MTDANRLFIDDVMASLLAAEDHVRSLEQDVDNYKELLRQALYELHSEKQLNRRLMQRLEKPRG